MKISDLENTELVWEDGRHTVVRFIGMGGLSASEQRMGVDGDLDRTTEFGKSEGFGEEATFDSTSLPGRMRVSIDHAFNRGKYRLTSSGSSWSCGNPREMVTVLNKMRDVYILYLDFLTDKGALDG